MQTKETNVLYVIQFFDLNDPGLGWLDCYLCGKRETLRGVKRHMAVREENNRHHGEKRHWRIVKRTQTDVVHPNKRTP